MEHGPVPDRPTPPQENSPSTPKAPRRPFSFLRKFGGEESPEPRAPKPEAKAQKPETSEKIERVEQPKKATPQTMGEKVLAFLGIQKAEATPPSNAPEAAPEAEAEPTTPKTEVVEEETVVDKAVEGARAIGRGVLNLIERVRGDVTGAEAGLPRAERIDTKPLAEAEEDVHEAVDGLEGAAKASAVEYSAGGDGLTLEAKQEAAAAEAWRAAGRAIEAEQRLRQEQSVARQVGAVAVGLAIATAGGFLYTWHKVRGLRKEQQQVEKAQKQQQREIRKSFRKIEELQQKRAEDLTQANRQELVLHVSDYAHEQAERIRDVSRAKEALAERAVAAVAIRARREREVVPSPIITPEIPELAPIATKTIERKQTFTELMAEKVIEAKERFARSKSGGNVAGTGGGVVDALFNNQGKPLTTAQKAQLAKAKTHPQPVQAWLNGVLLALGIVLLITVFLAIF